MKEKYKYLGKNTLIFAISSFGTKFLSFFLLPLYTRILTTKEYGAADLVTTTGTLLIYLFTLNICEAVIRFGIEKAENSEEILSYGLKVFSTGSTILAALMLIISNLSIVRIDKVYFLFIYLYFLFVAAYQILSNYLRAVDQIWDVAVAGILYTLVVIVCNITLLVFFKLGVIGYLISIVSGPLAAGLYCFVRARVNLLQLFRLHCSSDDKKEMLRYSVPLVFNSIALWINAFLDKYFVSGMLGVAQNGIYAVSYKIPTILSTVYMVFSQAWNLSAIKEYDENDKDGFFSKTYTTYNALVVLACSFLVLINIPMAKFLYAKDFFEAWKYSSILLVFVMFNAMTAFMGSIFSAVKNSKVIAMTTIMSAALNALLNFLLIPRIGVYGAAIATVSSYVFLWGIRLILIRRYITLNINIFKDSAAYSLVCLQVFAEHTASHMYVLQVCVLLLLLVIYRKDAVSIFKIVLDTLRQKLRRKS